MTCALRGALTGIPVGLATSVIAADAYRCALPGLECLPVVSWSIAAALVVALLLGWVTARVLRATAPLLVSGAGLALTLLIVVAVGGEAPAEPPAMAAMAAAGYATSALAFAPPTPVVVRAGAGVLLTAALLVLLYHL